MQRFGTLGKAPTGTGSRNEFHAIGSLLTRAGVLPTPMYPVPLLRVPEDQALKHSVVGARSESDLLAHVFALDRWDRILEAPHVSTVGFAPARGRHHWSAGRERDNGQTLEGPPGMSKEFSFDPIGGPRVLVERKNDDVAGGETLEDGIQRPALGQDAEPSAPKAPRHQGIQPSRLDGAADEMKAIAHVRVIAEDCDGRHLEVAEVAGQHQGAFAMVERPIERLDVLQARRRASTL